MSSRRCNDALHAKRHSIPFSIEALIGGKDRGKNDDDDDKEDNDLRVQSRNDFDAAEEEKEDGRRVETAAAAGRRQAPRNVELDVERLTRQHPSESIAAESPSRKLSQRSDDDDDDEGDGEEGCEGLHSLQRSSEGPRRDDDVTDRQDRQHHHHPQHHNCHPYQHHLQQFQQLFGRHPAVQSMIDVHPAVMRQNLLTATHGSSSRLAASDAAVRRPLVSGSSGNPAALFCCPPSPAAALGQSCGGGAGGVSQRTGAVGLSRADDELVPFYSWLLSRHGAFFNHRIHPAGILHFSYWYGLVARCL